MVGNARRSDTTDAPPGEPHTHVVSLQMRFVISSNREVVEGAQKATIHETKVLIARPVVASPRTHPAAS